MDSDDSDMVVIENVPSMSVVASLYDHPQSSEASNKKELGRHISSIPSDPCYGISGSGVNHNPTAHFTQAQIQKSVTQPNIDKDLQIKESNVSPASDVRPHGEIFLGQGDKKALNSIGFPPLPKLPFREKIHYRESEQCGPPPPPPPPPPPGVPQFLNVHGVVPPLPPPPPPPPPPGALPAFLEQPVNPDDEVCSPAAFLPAQYTGDSVLDIGSRVVRLVPFRRNVFTTRHRAQAGDLQEHLWILKNGSPDFWYEKPARTYLKNIRTPEGLLHLLNARPVSLETPRVWASSAFTTPSDNDIYDCVGGHTLGGYSATCHKCTDDKSDALEKTPLVYYLVFSTCQASDPFIHGAHFNGCQIYRLVKCGSREAAAAEAFYAAGVNGWSIAFSCAMRLGEDFEERIGGKVKRVADLWMLAEEEKDENVVRIFY